MTKLPLSFGLTRRLLRLLFSKGISRCTSTSLKKTKEQKAIGFLSYRSSPFTQENWLTVFVLAANKQKAAEEAIVPLQPAAQCKNCLLSEMTLQVKFPQTQCLLSCFGPKKSSVSSLPERKETHNTI